MKTRKYALVAGWSLLIMGVTAGFSFGYVHGNLVLPDNPTMTLTNLKASSALFGGEVIGWFIILLTDLLVAWSLYRFFESVDQKASITTGVIRIVYSAVLAFAIYHLIAVWQLVSTLSPDALEMMALINNFEKYWSLGLIIFGMHLVGLGYLAVKSNTVPKWMGWLLYIAGVSYTAINSAKAVAHEAANIISTVEMILSAPMAIAELGFGIWLIWKGGKKADKINPKVLK
jgi:hypothetical protein